MSLLKIIRAQLGLSATATDNFTLDASAANGSMKLARGNAGATTQDIVTVDSTGKVGLPGGLGDVASLPAFVCRAWGTFSFSSGVRNLLGGGNVASVADSGDGWHTVTFSTPMPDTNYNVILSVRGDSNLDTFMYTAQMQGSDTKTVNGFRFRTKFGQQATTFSVLVNGEASFAIFR